VDDPGPPDSAYEQPAGTGDGESLVIDILTPQPRRDCASDNPDEIVVCAKAEDDAKYRLPKLDPRYANAEDDDNRLRGTIAGAEVLADTEQANVGGWPSNRFKVTAKIDF